MGWSYNSVHGARQIILLGYEIILKVADRRPFGLILGPFDKTRGLSIWAFVGKTDAADSGTLTELLCASRLTHGGGQFLL